MTTSISNEQLEKILKLAEQGQRIFDSLNIKASLQEAIRVRAESLKVFDSSLNGHLQSVQKTLRDAITSNFLSMQEAFIQQQVHWAAKLIQPQIDVLQAFKTHFEFIGEQWTKRLAEINQSMNREIIRGFQEAAEYFIRLETEKEALKPLSQMGLFISPSMDKKLLERVKYLYAQNREGEIMPLVLRYYRFSNHRRLKQLIRNLSTNPLFAQRMPIINDALDAHAMGKYTLSIPALLTQIEGIVGDFVLMNGISANLAKKEIFEKAIDESTPKGLHAFAMAEGMLAYIKKLYKGEEFKKSKVRNKSELNRHRILHGRSIKYANEENSLRLFLLLDALSILIVKDPDEFEKFFSDSET